jgi:16S rRNA (uracil1498-N3)-methyltransferase
VHRFFVPDFSGADRVDLPADEAEHAIRVLRLGVGDAVAVFDGKGRECDARIERVEPKRVEVRVGAPRTPAPEARVDITLAQALLKGDKMDRVLRDAVMLGVSAIQPLLSRRTEVPRMALGSGRRRDRWRRTILSSVKQCGRAVVPAVFETLELSTVVKSASTQPHLMFVEPTPGASVAGLADLEGRRPSRAMILIGPEGGWDRREIDEASGAGVTLVTLGGSVLRADAAAAAAIVVLRYIWRDL